MRLCTFLFIVFFLGILTDCNASGSGKYASHSSYGHASYNLGVRPSGTSVHSSANHTSTNGHKTNSIGHTNTGTTSSYYSNPKSSYHSTIVGNSTYFRANKNPPKHSEEDDRYTASKKAKADKDIKAPDPAPKTQHAIDPFKPKPKPKPGTYTPAAPIFLPN